MDPRNEAAMSSTQRTTDDINLAVLRRHNPSVASIAYIAPFAVIYVFSNATQSWEKPGVEGSLFVCLLHPENHASSASKGGVRAAVIVLNRHGLQNFDLELHSSETVADQPPFIVLQGGGTMNDDGESLVYGLWIYNEPGTSTENARDMTLAMIQQCAAMVESSRIVALTPSLPPEYAAGLEYQNSRSAQSVPVHQPMPHNNNQHAEEDLDRDGARRGQDDQAAHDQTDVLSLLRQARQDCRSTI